MISTYLQRASAVFFLLCLSEISFALDPIYTRGSSNIAIRGYDTVAYFTVNKALKGSKEIQHEHAGAVWNFASESNRALFVENPEKYMPQYGGYCAYAVSRNTTASVKPKVFKIHDDKLYLNYSAGVQRRWLKKMKKNIETANKHWPAVLEK